MNRAIPAADLGFVLTGADHSTSTTFSDVTADTAAAIRR
jgi:hypothetical protein